MTLDQNVFGGLARLLISSGQLDEVLSIFCRNANQRITKLFDAVGSSDLQEIKNVSHSLKGSCGMIGASESFELCQQLENATQSNDIPRCREVLQDLSKEIHNVVTEINTFCDHQRSHTKN